MSWETAFYNIAFVIILFTLFKKQTGTKEYKSEAITVVFLA